MSSISSVSSYGASSVYGLTGGTSRPPPPPKPDASKMAEDLFSKLDTSNQGYLQKSDFENAFASISSASSSSTDSSTTSTGTSLSADDVFNALDSNGDGKLTKTELSDSLKALSDQLDSQFDQSRMASAMQAGGMPPPPPPSGSSGGDEGYTKDQLSSMATELSSTDAAGSSMFSTLAANFDKADTNGDGKVSFQESQAYLQSTSSSSTADSSTSASTTSSSTSNTLSESKILRQIEELLKRYGSNVSDSSIATLLSSVSTTA